MTDPDLKAPEIRGRCPGALRPMMSGDGLVVRLRVPMGRLLPAQALGIADLSRRFGNGLMDLTNRGNLQLRGVTPGAHPALLTALDALNLLDSDAGAEARRNILLSPDATPGGWAWQVAGRLAELMSVPDAPAIPGKFGFAIDLDPPALADSPADIRLLIGREHALICAEGRDRGLLSQTPAEDAVALAHWFLATGGAPDGRGRMKDHAAPLPPGHDHPLPAAQPGPEPGQAINGWRVGFAFGQIEADTLAGLAALGPLRLTPWRQVVIEGLTRAPDLPGLILRPDDPLRRIHACTGAPGCPQARAETRQTARDLGADLPEGMTLHISGCAKGCALRNPASLTLVATGPDRFDAIRDGLPGDPPHRTGLHRAALRDFFFA